MHLPIHILRKQNNKKKKNKKSDRSSRPNNDGRKSDKAQASSHPQSDEKKSDKKQATSNTSNPAYPGNKKKETADGGYGYGYGYKKSTNSQTTQAKSSQIAISCDLIEEDRQITKEMNKKSLSSTLLMFFVAMIIIALLNASPAPHYVRTELKYAYTSPSTTHYKFAILTNDLDVSRIILELPMDLAGYGQREAAFTFSLFAKILFENIEDGLQVNASLGKFVSHLSWGFDQEVGSMNPGPMIVHNEKIFDSEFERAMIFPELRNTSLMATPLNLGPFANMFFDRDFINGDLTYISRTKTPRDIKFDALQSGYSSVFSNSVKSKFSKGNRSLPLSSLTHYITDQFEYLQIASSGPKTLGSIAEIAIRMSLEKVANRYKHSMPAADVVDVIVAQTIIHTLDAVALQDEYFKNLILNKTEAMEQVRARKNESPTKSIVTLETSGALTTTLLIMDNRDGWPTVFHYSVSAPGPFFLRALDKNSTEMVNSCQIIVLRDGYIWLTAAASGEFYLLEKVVSSIVHKIVRDSDPLSEMVHRKRYRYDTRTNTIKTDRRADEPFPKESLQFVEYDILKDRFRSWNQRSRNSTSHKFKKWNIATGA